MASPSATSVTLDWCTICGTRHASGRCPGEVLTTDPERHGWRGTFVTPQGEREAIGVLVAPAGHMWRARILTYPNTLWTAPESVCTIKFVGEKPELAENQAREFIEQHCRRRGYEVAEDQGVAVPVADFKREQKPQSEGFEASRRRLCDLTLRAVCDDGPAIKGKVVQMSERGFFVTTGASVPVGSSLRIQLELDGVSVAMHGEVRTLRSHATPGRPQGLGVRLTDPPARYLAYVRRLP